MYKYVGGFVLLFGFSGFFLQYCACRVSETVKKLIQYYMIFTFIRWLFLLYVQRMKYLLSQITVQIVIRALLVPSCICL
jgi:hypothetical protein